MRTYIIELIQVIPFVKVYCVHADNYDEACSIFEDGFRTNGSEWMALTESQYQSVKEINPMKYPTECGIGYKKEGD